MGIRYVIYRIYYIFKKKTGILQKQFPTSYKPSHFIGLDQWKSNSRNFFIDKSLLKTIQFIEYEKLRTDVENIKNGYFDFFYSQKYYIGTKINWFKNVSNNYEYPREHWTKINELSSKSGDIKYVWELSRFSYLYTIIRYDLFSQEDQSFLVFSLIENWIDSNPMNIGPNYICSQEISLRVLNWIFALYYYKNSKCLNEQLFQKIINSIVFQIDHVYKNINFSRFIVRNNHALTETLTVYLVGLLFPWFPQGRKWKKKGKKWFEKEIQYQIYKDGTYLQYSNNYHRVVIQLLTWGIRISEINNEHFSSKVYVKAKKSLDFLLNSINITDGNLPNYGSNDGSLFFKLNSKDYNNYKPQLQALAFTLKAQDKILRFEDIEEDVFWFGIRVSKEIEVNNKKTNDLNINILAYREGGIYIINDNNSKTFINCCKYYNRPAHADNLHIDIWYKGINFLRDNGTFLYNTDEDVKRYFMGTFSHNTIVLDDFDQMLKGPNFIWTYWSKMISTNIIEEPGKVQFSGTINAFRYVDKKILHTRKIIKHQDEPVWEIIDFLKNAPERIKYPLWHPHPSYLKHLDITAYDANNIKLEKQIKDGWNSKFYGEKTKTKIIYFKTQSDIIKTKIKINL